MFIKNIQVASENIFLKGVYGGFKGKISFGETWCIPYSIRYNSA